jgi:hypothetical protein
LRVFSQQGETLDKLMLIFIQAVPEKRRTGRQLAQMVDDFVERHIGDTLTETRRLVADDEGVSVERVERAHQRYGKHKGRNKPGHFTKQ